jgi:hypothetical protein
LPTLERLPDRQPVPAAEDPATSGHARPSVDRGRDGQADGQDLVHRGLHRLGHVHHEQRGLVEFGVRAVVAGQGHVPLGQDGPVEVGQGQPQVPGRDVDAGDQAEAVWQRHPQGAASARGARGGVQGAGGDEFLDDVRHGRGAEAGRTGQLDLRQAAVALDRRHDTTPVGFTQ